MSEQQIDENLNRFFEGSSIKLDTGTLKLYWGFRLVQFLMIVLMIPLFMTLAYYEVSSLTIGYFLFLGLSLGEFFWKNPTLIPLILKDTDGYLLETFGKLIILAPIVIAGTLLGVFLLGVLYICGDQPGSLYRMTRESLDTRASVSQTSWKIE